MFQCRFGSRKIWIRSGRLLRPAITGERFEICRGATANGHPVCVRTVSIDIHIRLKQKGFSVRLGMLKLQNGLAIEKVMPRKEQIQASEVFTQFSGFRIVELSVKR